MAWAFFGLGPVLHEVSPPSKLWIGSASARADVALHHITHVLCLQTAQQRRYNHESYATLPSGVQEMTVEGFEDASGVELYRYVPDCIRFIAEAFATSSNHSVLVHCSAGVSRSAAIVVAYLMYTRDLTADVALDLVRQTRGMAHPNSSFMRQLREEIPGVIQEIRDGTI